MSEFKFACPVCGQHITCDSSTSGKQMECPTCFRKLTVPHPPAAGSPNLVLTASEVTNRPLPQTGAGDSLVGASSAKKFPMAGVAFLLVLLALVAGVFVFRDKIFKTAQNQPAPVTNAPAKKKPKPVPKVIPPPASDTNWTLNLADVKIPEAPAAGRIHGSDFLAQRATLQGGTLNFRQGATGPPDLGLTILLFAKQGEDLAGQTINIETNRDKSPKLILRWKDEEQKPATKNFTDGYALRLEFSEVNGKRLPGKIYLCAPDDAKSYLAGTFTAEIRRPPPPKPPKAPKPKQPPAPKKAK